MKREFSMPDADTAHKPGKSRRIVSIDVLRGLTIGVMIFVNDLAGVKGTPGWMKHYYPYEADGMTFVDVVFPAFLFIVGMAIPFAIGRRLLRGESPLRVWRHILIRTFGLLVIGVFMVNSYTISSEGLLNHQLWIFLMYLGVILTWNFPASPSQKAEKITNRLRWVGIAMLAALVFLYRGNNASGILQIRTQWWGILGLIGWAYLVSCLFYTFLKKSTVGMIGATVFLYVLYVLDRYGVFSGFVLDKYVDIGSMLGSHAGITASGVVLGMILTPQSRVKTHKGRLLWGMVYGFAMIVAGILLHQLKGTGSMWIINKNAATVPWCLISAGITCWVWAACYLLLDVAGFTGWTVIVRPAGENPLFAYILQPMIYSFFALIALATGGFDPYASLGGSFAVGFWRSLVFAFLVTWIVGLFKKLGVRLKL